MSDAAAISDAPGTSSSARMRARAIGSLLFGLRLWASVCLALYVAFRLELGNPSWAATTAALVCQPQLGASLRKGSFRLVGTVVGGIASVAIAVVFPQDRVGFLAALAAWGAVCGFVGAGLKNYAAYGAGLAGFTAAVIAGDVFGPTGGVNGDILTVASNRVVEIAVGIVSAEVVLALTDLGGARRRLGAEFASVAVATLSGFVGSVSASDPDEPKSRSVRRAIMRQIIALDPMIDVATGEASDLRYRSRILQGAVDGMIETLSAWRAVALHLGRLSNERGRRKTEPIARIMQGLTPRPLEAGADAARLRDACCAGARAAARLKPDTPSSQLLADAAAEGLIGMGRALNGLTLVVDARHTRRQDALAALHVPDWLPPAIIAVRAFVTVGLVMLFWIATAWPSGPLAITFAMVVAVVFALQGDQAYSAAIAYLVGVALSAILAGGLVFQVLPTVITFPALCLVLALAYVPLGFLIAWPWRPAIVGAVTISLMPLLSLRNAMTYDAAQFYNSALAIVVGVAVGMIPFRILPPLSPATRTRRLLRLTLAEMRRMAQGRLEQSRRKWEARCHARIIALPDGAEPIERAYMASVLAVGTRIIRLRTIAPRFVTGRALDAALVPIAEGRIAAAIEGLHRLDHELTAAEPHTRTVRRLRAAALAISEELGAFPDIFYERGPG